jgi:hypothetical protein
MKTKVFLSWSGPVSKAVALALHQWLPQVIQAIDPWMSSEDIKKGAAWDPVLAKALAEAKAGVICLTPDNLEEPWLLFEAGAIYNTPWHANVCTYLLGVTNSALTGPLTRFQWTVSIDKQENRKLLDTINSTLGDDALDHQRLEKAFESNWPELDEKLRQISTTHPAETPRREVTDMVEETLNIVRGLQKQSAEPPKLQPVYYTVDSPPFAPHPPSEIEMMAGLMGTVGAGGAGAASAKAFIPGGSSDDLAGYTRVNFGGLHESGPQGPRAAIRPRKSNNPNEK